MEGRRWADVMDDDSTVGSLDSQAIEELVPGGGHIYQRAIEFGEISIVTQGDFAFHMQSVYEGFMHVMPGPASEALWSEIARDMMDTSSPDTMDAAAYELLMMLSDVDVAATAEYSVQCNHYPSKKCKSQ